MAKYVALCPRQSRLAAPDFPEGGNSSFSRFDFLEIRGRRSRFSSTLSVRVKDLWMVRFSASAPAVPEIEPCRVVLFDQEKLRSG
ncbi:hypothetical protein R1flu_006704 [Riccia fluitans]|uniref:Uncharacterized protein n=1 Tax=Riccia fluitans TaxID=41844 RepID=A0ABD1YWS3_9MARC